MGLIERAIGMLEKMSPLGYVIAGGALAVTLVPSAGKVLRRAAVLTTRGVLALTSTATVVTEGAANTIREELEEIVDEARTELEGMAAKDNVINMNEHNGSETVQITETQDTTPKPKQTRKKK